MNSIADGLLEALYRSAVDAVSAAPAVRRGLAGLQFDGADRIWLLALGKAASGMAEGAVAHLRTLGRDPSGGVIVAPAATRAPHAALTVCDGEHPIPGHRSARAAREVERIVGETGPHDAMLVLLSGGATSLVAAPAGDFTVEELARAFTLLLRSGLDIAGMNVVRKRLSRWGAGRLAQHVRCARVSVLVISDVIGDDLAIIASGPCMPDPLLARDVRAHLEGGSLWEPMPPGIRRYIAQAELDASLETPKPGDRVFDGVEHHLVASNRQALDAAARRARALGFAATVEATPLAGEAAAAGAMIARRLAGQDDGDGPRGRCTLWGGETIVRLAGEVNERGGRCQELALACARELHARGCPPGVSVLAAGTDGRDGNSDAAGAIVDSSTWQRIIDSGRDPEVDLQRHASADALAAAGALLHTGLTGTNVMDVVIGMHER